MDGMMMDRWLSSGSGSGNGIGNGYSYGSGNGNGNGSGYGNGSSSGNGSGNGNGNGNGNGSGYSSGYGYDITEIEGRKVYDVDGVPTIIYAIKGDVAKAATLRNNVDIVPCYVAKSGGCFAHGDTPAEALRDAEDKYAESLPEEERVAMVYEAHPDYDEEVGSDELFRLHHLLTGSCEFGRREWCRTHGIDLCGGRMTMREFCRLTADAYGGRIIKMLIDRYEQERRTNDDL